MSRPYAEHGAATLSRATTAGEVAPEDVVAAAEAAWLAEDGADAELNAFLSVDFRRARRDADALAARLATAAEQLPLAGVPVALQDDLATTTLPTTCASRLLDGYRSPYEATVVRRLREAGALVVGKTNVDEFGLDDSTEYSAYGPTRNPLDPEMSAGASGGAAAAVAAGIVPCAIGGDGYGAVRQSAAFCGLVGMRATRGMISRYGLIGAAPSLDDVGVLARCVADVALLAGALAGHDRLDPASVGRAVPDLAAALHQPIHGIVVGVPEEMFPESLDTSVRERVREALRLLESLGAQVRAVRLPHAPAARDACEIITTVEGASNLARYDGIRFGAARVADDVSAEYRALATRAAFGSAARRCILLGTHLLAHDDGRAYTEAMAARARAAADFEALWRSGVDLCFTPTVPAPASVLGGESTARAERDSARFTAPASLAGLPALSLPIGTVGTLPVGGQLIGPRWSEPTLIRVAHALERLLDATSTPAAA